MKYLLKILFIINFSIVTIGQCSCQIIAKNTNWNKTFLTASILEKNRNVDSILYKPNKITANSTRRRERSDEAIKLDKLAEAKFKHGLLTEAKQYNQSLLMLAQSLNDTALLINAKNREGLIFYEKGNYKDAELRFYNALMMSKKFPNRIPEIQSNLGSLFLALGEKEKAVQHFFKALELYEKTNNYFGIGETNSNISSVYYLMGKLDNAIEYQKKSIEMREVATDKNGLVIANNNLGQLYILKGAISLANKHIKTAINYAEELKNPKLLAVAFAGMGTYYIRCLKNAEALIWQTKALKLYEEIDDKQQLSRLYVSVGNLADANKDSAQAASYFEKALETSKAMANKENIGNVYEKMSVFYNVHGDYKKALKHYKTFIIYKDSISAKSNLSKIEEIKTQYETEKKDNEIAKLTIEQKIKSLQLEKQNAVIEGNILLAKKKEAEIALLAGESLLLTQAGELQGLRIKQQSEELDRQKLISKNAAQQLEINANEKMTKENELAIAKKVRSLLLAGLIVGLLLTGLFINRYQLKKKLEQQTALLHIRNSISKDLHDEIGSTLTSISILSNVSELALDKQPAQAKEMIHQIALQSKTIQQSMSDIVWSIRSENESIENLTTRIREYAAQTLEPLNIDATIAFDENIVTQKLPMRYRKEILLICKEAINNVAKHSGANQVSVSIKKIKQTLLLTIIDNGTWKGSTTGTGTKTMMERAISIGGTLKLSNNIAGTNITAIVPIP